MAAGIFGATTTTGAKGHATTTGAGGGGCSWGGGAGRGSGALTHPRPDGMIPTSLRHCWAWRRENLRGRGEFLKLGRGNMK